MAEAVPMAATLNAAVCAVSVPSMVGVFPASTPRWREWIGMAPVGGRNDAGGNGRDDTYPNGHV